VTVTTAPVVPRRTLVWVDRAGHEEPIPVPARPYTYVRLSPDETRIALDTRDAQNDIWIWDLVRKNLYNLTRDPGVNRMPIWTPDSKRVAFTAERDGVESVYSQAADGSGSMSRLSTGTQFQGPQSFSPDGKQLIFSTPIAPPHDLGVMTLGKTPNVVMLLHTKANETNAEISPDGRWLAYASDESGSQLEIYVRPFPNVDNARKQVSTGGGTRPVWSRNRRELFYYVFPDTIMAVPVHLGEEGEDITMGIPQPVVKGPYAVAINAGRHYDVSANGQRFLLLKDAPTMDGQKSAAPEIRLLLNWQEELKQRVPTR
jgi:Tol biopolymer transport system component